MEVCYPEPELLGPGLAQTQGPENAAHHCWPGSLPPPPDIELGFLWLLGPRPPRGRQQPRWSPWADPSPAHPSLPGRASSPQASLLPRTGGLWLGQTPFVNVRARTWRPETGRAAWPGPPGPGGLREAPFRTAQRKWLPPPGHSTSEDAAPRPPEPLAATLTTGSQRADAPVVGPATARRPSRACGRALFLPPRAPGPARGPRLEPAGGPPGPSCAPALAQLITHRRRGPRGRVPLPGDGLPPTRSG